MKNKALGSILFFVALNLQSQEFNKSIIIDDFFYQPVSGESSQFIFFQNIIDTTISADSFSVSASLKKENGVYFSNPLSWDILDSLLFVVNIFEDHFGMNFRQLKSYNIVKLKKLCLTNEDSLVNYLLSTKSIKSKPIGPLEKYSSYITYSGDTLVGKIYFDIFCKKKELNLILYLESVNKVEIWTFTRFPISIGIINTSDKVAVERIYNKKPWELIASISLDNSIAAPFKTVHTKDNGQKPG